jgi:hypothetical protein
MRESKPEVEFVSWSWKQPINPFDMVGAIVSACLRASAFVWLNMKVGLLSDSRSLPFPCQRQQVEALA